MFNDLLENLSKRLVLKVHELRRSNAELQNLLEVGATPAVFVDEDLRIRHFSPQISKIYALTDRDIGRPLDTVESTLDYDELARDFQLVMRTGESVERYSIGRSETVLFLLRIHITRQPAGGWRPSGRAHHFHRCQRMVRSTRESGSGRYTSAGGCAPFSGGSSLAPLQDSGRVRSGRRRPGTSDRSPRVVAGLPLPGL